MAICYLNTDLDLAGPASLTALEVVFETSGMLLLDVFQADDGQWYARFEADEQSEEPEPNIAAMLAVIESLREAELGAWQSCTLREFNIGYECGSEPWAFNQGLSTETLRRMVHAGTSLRLTLYPPEHIRPSPP